MLVYQNVSLEDEVGACLEAEWLGLEDNWIGNVPEIPENTTTPKT